MTAMTANLQPAPQPAQPIRPPAASAQIGQSPANSANVVAQEPPGCLSTPAPAPQAAEPPVTPQEPAKRKRGRKRGGFGRKKQIHYRRKVGAHGNRAACKYVETYAKQAYDLALVGLTDEKIAAFFRVSPPTLYNWRKRHKKFDNALKDGRLKADGKVANSMFQAACGYQHPDVHVQVDTKTGRVFKVPLTRYYPPSVAAASLILRNRHPDLWKDRQETATTGANGQNFSPVIIHITSEVLPPPRPPERVVEAVVSAASAPAQVSAPQSQVPRQDARETVAAVHKPPPVAPPKRSDLDALSEALAHLGQPASPQEQPVESTVTVVVTPEVLPQGRSLDELQPKIAAIPPQLAQQNGG